MLLIQLLITISSTSLNYMLALANCPGDVERDLPEVTLKVSDRCTFAKYLCVLSHIKCALRLLNFRKPLRNLYLWRLLELRSSLHLF